MALQLGLPFDFDPDERTQWPPGHVVHMSLDHSERSQSVSVGTCDCGFVSRCPWPGERLCRLQDAAIEGHWRAVEIALRSSESLT